MNVNNREGALMSVHMVHVRSHVLIIGRLDLGGRLKIHNYNGILLDVHCASRDGGTRGGG